MLVLTVYNVIVDKAFKENNFHNLLGLFIMYFIVLLNKYKNSNCILNIAKLA